MQYRIAMSYREIQPEAVATSEARIIDVRDRHEFFGELGHIPGAELVPLRQLLRELQAWNRDDRILLVCRSGARSRAAADILVRAGFRDVLNLDGGTLGYREAGLPTTRK